MVSFYALPSSILGNDKHTLLRAAYCYYLFANKTKLVTSPLPPPSRSRPSHHCHTWPPASAH